MGARNRVSFRSTSFVRLNFITELELNREDIIYIYTANSLKPYSPSLQPSPSPLSAVFCFKRFLFCIYCGRSALITKLSSCGRRAVRRRSQQW